MNWASFAAHTQPPADRMAEAKILYTAGYSDAMHLVASMLAQGCDTNDLANTLLAEIVAVRKEASL